MLLAEGNRAHQGRGRVIDLFVQLEIDSDANDIAATVIFVLAAQVAGSGPPPVMRDKRGRLEIGSDQYGAANGVAQLNR